MWKSALWRLTAIVEMAYKGAGSNICCAYCNLYSTRVSIVILKSARRVLKEEAMALKKMAGYLGTGFEKAVRLIKSAEGKVVVVGMGKSGLIGRKIAATLSSTGTSSFFLHAAESLHGDIGVVDSKDVVLLLSYSGTTDEFALMLPAIKNKKASIIVMTGNKNSKIAKSCDAIIEINIEREACPLNLAPTTSTTVMLAVGDALAIALLEERGFKVEDFATLHPGGTLGRKLLLGVNDIINKSGVNPVVKIGNSVKDALLEMTRSRVGATSVVDAKGNLVGYFTDGDLRRGIQNDPGILEKRIEEVMTPNPTTVRNDRLAIDVKEILRKNKFDNLPVVDKDGRPVGIIDERDIIEEGL